MLNLLRFLPWLIFLLLQACQQSSAVKAEQSVQLQKRNEAASYNTQLGLAYLKQGDRPRAKRKLLTALDLAPDSADVNVAMAYYFEKTGEIKKAQAYYQKALALAPDSGAQLNNFGTFLCRLGRYKEAERYFLKAVNDIHYIHTAAAYENAGLCAAAMPDYPKAKHYYVKALQQDPRRKQALYELAVIELKEKHASKALEYIQKYPALSLNDPNMLAMAVNAARQAGKKILNWSINSV
ncbi:type IV pilus biogenesis/stability protein PilW [Legionella tunisiensis]|uniref:type IV pilus biogenesis/stability protein PilW n=1 Tax=Legionella tunisiensis TaxID=1034944 RepID=UPI00037483C4|nr:type IV pilus biogenesis/stability protein PilW [Legionella tunisiensis]